MHPESLRQSADELFALGLNDTDAARRLGLPRSTVRDWRRPREVRDCERCPRCWKRARPIRFTAAPYAELLGLYLGDGCITDMGRSYRLRITLDTAYPVIIQETCALLRTAFPGNAVAVVPHTGERCVYISLYSRHLPCLFPQHGPGKKHHRSVALEPWQLELVEQAPWDLLRGLIRSDGCVFVNRTAPYEYLSYAFCNCSDDIARLFVDTAAACGLRPRATKDRHNRWMVRINRRGCVARMIEHVGLKE